MVTHKSFHLGTLAYASKDVVAPAVHCDWLVAPWCCRALRGLRALSLSPVHPCGPHNKEQVGLPAANVHKSAANLGNFVFPNHEFTEDAPACLTLLAAVFVGVLMPISLP